MAIQRISTYSVHQRTLSDVNRTQSNLYDLQNQISSGFKTDTFSGLNGQIEQYVQLEAKIRKTDVYIENNSVALSRLNTTQTTLDKIIELADQMEDLIVLRRNPASQNMNFSLQMDNLRSSVAAMLNTNFDGRYIFGGTRTNVQPVIDDPIPDSVAIGTPDDIYYQGSPENPILRTQDNQEIEYGVLANDQGFQKIFGAALLSKKGDGSNSDDVLEDAMAMMQEGIQDIITAKARVDSNIVAISNINDRHTDLKLYWQGVREDIINTDMVAASTSVAVDQAVLQASFQSFATINRLRLVDFL